MQLVSTSKRSSDESEIQNFKRKFVNNRKTKSFGAININELFENKKNPNPQINLISTNFHDFTRKKQDSDPINTNKVINSIINSSTNTNNSNSNFPSHLQISKLYKDAKGQKYQTGTNKKYFLSNIDETVFTNNSNLTDKAEKEKPQNSTNKKINFNKESTTYLQTSTNIGNTAQLVSSLLSSNTYCINKGIKKSVHISSSTTNKDKEKEKKYNSNNALINIDLTQRLS